MKKIGLVGGISWVSTIEYYKLINEGIHHKLGGLNYAECLIHSLNFGDVQKIGWHNSYNLLLGACLNLQKGGTEAIVLCANTAHLFIDELQEGIQIPIIDLVLETVKEIKNQKLKKVGVLGTQFTMEMDFFKEKLKTNGIETLIPEEEATRIFIQKTLKEELGKGVFNTNTKKEYLSIINKMIANGAEGIVLACTEIPLMITSNDVAVPIFNTTFIHSKAAVNFALAIN